MTHPFPTRRSSDLGAQIEGAARAGQQGIEIFDQRWRNQLEPVGTIQIQQLAPQFFNTARFGGKDIGQTFRQQPVGHHANPKITINENRQIKGDLGRKPAKSLAKALSCKRYRPLFRSEEHTSELQSLMRISYAVFCLKKKKNKKKNKKLDALYAKIRRKKNRQNNNQ